jgi:sugar lactone lactonase YvrE
VDIPLWGGTPGGSCGARSPGPQPWGPPAPPRPPPPPPPTPRLQLFVVHPTGPSIYGPARRLASIAPGRSLGAAFGPTGRLFVCSAPLGLLEVTPDPAGGPPSISVLTSRVSRTSALEPGKLLGFANDLDVAADGTIYFSHSTDIGPWRCGARHARGLADCALAV